MFMNNDYLNHVNLLPTSITKSTYKMFPFEQD